MQSTVESQDMAALPPQPDDDALRESMLLLRDAVEEYLAIFIGQRALPDNLRAATEYALLGGGKRLRPVLVLRSCQAVTGALDLDGQTEKGQAAMATAGAIELIHCFSLVHDDLPAMDDDSLRRGRPTCHVEFDEATAILAGDALHALAFQLLVEGGASIAGPLVSLVADAVGPTGMVGGQQIDLDAEGQDVTSEMVREIHTGKTARLLMAAVGAGALLAGIPAPVQRDLASAMLDLGLAFQGADDVLDVTATADELGKTAGKDAAAGKATWVRVEGLEKAMARVERYGVAGNKALSAALPPGVGSERLLDLAWKLWNRDS